MRLATFELKSHPGKQRPGAASTTPQQFLAFIRAENAKWAKLVKERGLVIEGGS